ncbi:MAG: PilW family protein [Calditrichia bacterium]
MQKDAGFTVIELIIAVQLTLLVIGMAYTSFLFAQKIYLRWQSKTNAEQQLNLIHQQYSVRLNKLTHIHSAESQLLIGQTRRLEKIELTIAEDIDSGNAVVPNGFYGSFFYLIDGQMNWNRSVDRNSNGGNETLPISAVKLEGNYWHNGKSFQVKIVQRLVRRIPIIR